jgi:hypothetical protein
MTHNDDDNTPPDTEIIEAAALQLAVDETPDDAVLMARFEMALNGIRTSGDYTCLVMASKILAGKTYSISTDNPETVERVRSMAATLGAAIDGTGMDNGQTDMRVTPPMKS